MLQNLMELLPLHLGSLLFFRDSGNTTHVGVYAKNSPEWFICALGSMQQSIVVVPLYDTLGPEAATFAVQQTEIRLGS
jgi:long-subunit acyl-CoA synthetase (AMP-forming)